MLLQSLTLSWFFAMDRSTNEVGVPGGNFEAKCNQSASAARNEAQEAVGSMDMMCEMILELWKVPSTKKLKTGRARRNQNGHLRALACYHSPYTERFHVART